MILVTEAEMAALVRIAGAPTPTSPLAGLPPSKPDRTVMASLGAKGLVSSSGALAPECQDVMTTLIDPLIKASLYIEGVGGGNYFGGTGGISGIVQVDEAQYRLTGGFTVDAILADLDSLLAWRTVPDAPPLRLDLSAAELTVMAALADAHREEQLLACIERRPAVAGAVTRDVAQKQIALGTSRADHRWLVSILSRFGPPASAPRADHLDSGAASLIARNLARTGDEALEIGPDLQVFISGFSSVTPFLGFAVHAPWEEQEIKLFTRGVGHFWSIEYLSAASRIRVARLGGRARETLLRQHLAPLDAHAATSARTAVAAPPAPAPAPAPKRVAAAPVEATACARCGRAMKPGLRFCTACGTPRTGGPT